MQHAWDPVWERIFTSRSWGRYPEEALIRFTARNYYGAEPRSAVHFLDLGCGMGASTWYLCREGFTVTAIDGSESAIREVRRRLDEEGYMARFDVGDIVALPYQAAEFDCVIDMHCLMCLPSEVAKEAVANIRRVLKPNGRLFSVTPRRGSWGDGIGRQIAPGTFADAPDGPYAHMGIARFTDEDDIRAVYEGFSTLKIDVVERTEQGRKYTVSFWTITCEV